MMCTPCLQVEIVHYLTDNDSIGDAICKRADALKARLLRLHNRGGTSGVAAGTEPMCALGLAW